jgi:hypothetical protein
MNRVILTCCLAILMLPSLGSPVRGQSPGKPQGVITVSGMYNITTPTKKLSAPETTSGTKETFDACVFTTRTQKIPARLGVHFGFMYTVSGLPANSTVKFRKIVTHPEIRKPDGTTSKGYVTFLDNTTSAEGKLSDQVTGYGFDHPYELVTGKWRIELWYGETKLAEKTYTVVKP